MNIKYVMEAKVIEEAGYEAALKGLSLSYKQKKDMTEVAQNLAPKDYGHNKFLESMIIWILVKAPRYWWQEADTYRISTKQSESTMHTLVEEFTGIVDWTKAFETTYCVASAQRVQINEALRIRDPNEKLIRIKQLLPESFLQRRMWCMSYKTLRNISIQRQNHRLIHWRSFLYQVYDQAKRRELLPALPSKLMEEFEEITFDYKD